MVGYSHSHTLHGARMLRPFGIFALATLSFLAGLGIVGIAIGFALQDIVKQFAAGVLPQPAVRAPAATRQAAVIGPRSLMRTS